MIGLLGIIASLGLLIYLAYRGLSVLILGPALSSLAVLLAMDVPMLATYTQVFMPAVGRFIVLYFPLFLLGALFGRLMDVTGSAQSISHAVVNRLGSKHAILAVVLACAVLTYGGVSLFVVAFGVFPIAANLFKQAEVPKRLIPASIALGAFTFTMTALPGSPAIQNAIPTPYFGTTTFAAPILGIISGLIMFVGGQLWLQRQARLASLNNEGYESTTGSCQLSEHGGNHEPIGSVSAEAFCSDQGGTNLFVAVVPIFLVVALNYIFSAQVFTRLNTDYLSQPFFGETSIESVRGIWSIVCALLVSIVVMIGLHFRKGLDLMKALEQGANGSVLPIFNTASLVGFGAVIASLPAFSLIQAAVESIGGGPLVSLAISVNLLAGITGSASGGMSIALEALGDTYMRIAQVEGISAELLHRVTSVATGGLDSLPHNGAVVTLLNICALTHKQAYKDIFFVAVIFPIVALLVLLVLGSLWGAF